MKNNISKRLIFLCLSTVFIFSTIVFSGCDKKKNNTDKNQVTTQQAQQPEVKPEEPPKQKKTQDLNIPYFEKSKLENNFQVKSNTSWKQSASGLYNVCIEGKGAQGQEEGIGKIIEKKNNGDIYGFNLKNAKKQHSPLYIQWAKEDKLFVTIGSGYGTVVKGGSLYLLDVENNINEQVLKPTDPKQMISKASLNGEKLELTMYIYDDDNFNNGHNEKWVVQPFDINLQKTMEVKNEKGTTVYKIN